MNSDKSKIATQMGKAFEDLVAGLRLYKVWSAQAYYEISAKFRRTFLGSLWISGAMVATSMALAIVMGGIMGQDLKTALPYVMSGILCFAIPNFLLIEAPDIFVAYANTIRNHAYPFSYYVFEKIARVFLLFAHNLIPFLIMMALIQKICFPHWTIILGLIVLYANCYFWGSLVAIAATRFIDLRFLLPFMSQIVFFVTPVWWHAENLTGWREIIYKFNPFYGLLEIIRSPLLGNMAEPHAWILSGVSTIIGVIMWLLFFPMNRSKIAFWV